MTEKRSVEPHSRLPVAVVSASSTLLERETTRSLEEMIFDTTTDALAQAGNTIDDMDSIVLSGNDEIDGRVISIMAAAGPAGGVGRDTTMIASSADHALVYGYLRLLAGQGSRVLVAGWAKPSESADPEHAELVESEPYILRNIGMNHTVAAALQASRWVDNPDGVEGAAVWPLTRADLPGRGDAVHATVLAVDTAFPVGSELAWILDAGWATGTYELGQRDPGDLEPLRIALAQIAKRTPAIAPSTWDAAEIAAGSEPAVRATAEILGMPPTASVNESGSLSTQLGSPHVAGLSRMLAAIRAVAAGKSRAAGIGYHGFAGQGATVVVFGSQKGDPS